MTDRYLYIGGQGPIIFNDTEYVGDPLDTTGEVEINEDDNSLPYNPVDYTSRKKKPIDSDGIGNLGQIELAVAGTGNQAQRAIDMPDAILSWFNDYARRGVTSNILLGGYVVNVTFATAFSDDVGASYSLSVTVENLTDTDMMGGMVTAKSKTGFTYTLGAPVPTGNYRLSYIAIPLV